MIGYRYIYFNFDIRISNDYLIYKLVFYLDQRLHVEGRNFTYKGLLLQVVTWMESCLITPHLLISIYDKRTDFYLDFLFVNFPFLYLNLYYISTNFFAVIIGVSMQLTFPNEWILIVGIYINNNMVNLFTKCYHKYDKEMYSVAV